MAGISALAKMYLVVFGCQHHRECWQGQLLVTFEGQSWAVLSTAVKDRLAAYGQLYQVGHTPCSCNALWRIPTAAVNANTGCALCTPAPVPLGGRAGPGLPSRDAGLGRDLPSPRGVDRCETAWAVLHHDGPNHLGLSNPLHIISVVQGCSVILYHP